ncbi:BON domain-containing protein [Paraburkholderia sp. DGU8]|uniref:BON domain-containing protein n=1 Tax=Paraburkholderia sp. DGU8 TaxID=3161997 RepID=UPI0034672F59
MSTDADIKRDVEYELKWDPDIDPSDIGVAVKDGAVTLSARLAARATDGEHGCAGRGQSEFWRLRTPARAKTRVDAADSVSEIRNFALDSLSQNEALAVMGG